MGISNVDPNVKGYYEWLNEVQVFLQDIQNKTDKVAKDKIHKLQATFDQFSPEVRVQGNIPRKLELVEKELKLCKVDSEFQKEIELLDEKIHKTAPPPKPPPSKPLPKEVKATTVTRLLALRDALFGAPITAIKGAVSLSAKFVLSFFVDLISSYSKGLAAGTFRFPILFLRLLANWAVGMGKAFLWLLRDMVLATVGVFRPSVWVKVAGKGKETSKTKNTARAFWGILSPRDGRVSAEQDGVFVKYTTRLEDEVEYRGKLFL